MRRTVALDENGLPIETRGRFMLVAVGAAVLACVAAVALWAFFFYLPSDTPPAAPENVAAAPAGDAAPAAPASPKVTTTTSAHGGWTVTCSEGGDLPRRLCGANFRVINKQTNTNMLVWLLGFNGEGQLLTEFMTLTDVMIQPGVVVTLDGGTPVKADFVECSTKGCKARLQLSPEMLEQLKGAQKATIDMTRVDGQVIQFTMDIPGIDRALAELGV